MTNMDQDSSGYRMAAIGQAVEDAQYGLRCVMNNYKALLASLGVSPETHKELLEVLRENVEEQRKLLERNK